MDLICFTVCACNNDKECIRDTAHLKQANCKDRTVPKHVREKEKSSRSKRDEESKSH
jgi:uncharacterized protein (UPF0147 family)